MKDPRPGLERLGVPYEETVPADDGYDGTYEPQCVYLHWTASAPGSDTARATVAANDYHSCLARNGTCHLGGWQVKQAHGGHGRTGPIGIARNGAMTVDTLHHWQLSGDADDTDSWPNRYGVAVAIDNSGVGEIPSDVQYHNWCKTAAAMLDAVGCPTAGHLIDHASSTNRKIDITPVVGVALLDPARWYPDIDTYLTLLRGGPAVAEIVARMALTPTGRGAWHVRASDGAVYATGDAVYFGGLNENPATGQPYTRSRCHSIIGSESGKGYVIGVEDGGTFAFGDAPFPGSAVDLIQ